MIVFNKSLFRIFFGALLLGFFCSGNSFAQTNRTITGNSAGNVRIGMTVLEARRAMPGYTFRRTSDGEGIALIQISRRNQTHMTLFAGEFDSGQPIDNTAKIEFIEVWNSVYRTTAGVHPQMRVRDVESRYGKLESIMLSEIEAREFARFTRQPAGIDLRLQNRNGRAGRYASGQTITTQYSTTAYVFSIIVLGGTGDVPIDNTGDNGNVVVNQPKNFVSQYTDLRTQCRTPRGQGGGGHISTYCQGPGGYQVHIFDTATTMEIAAQTTDGQKSVHLASQSLSFNRNNKKVEWRVHDGKPFAVIMRAAKYRLGEDGLIQYPEVRTGEYLFVKGLPGYEHIDYEVRTTTRNANEKARQMADAGFDGKNTGSTSTAQFQDININRFNNLIRIGNQRREAWVKSATQVVVRLIGDMSEVKTRNIRFIAPSAENVDSITAVVTDDGLLDDSVRSERLRLQLRRDSASVWSVISGKRAWRCQQRRGHQDFSAVPCN